MTTLQNLATYHRKVINVPILSLTGSNGKTTTASLTHHLLKGDLNVGLAGNIGDSFAKQILEDDFENYVLEISSFQSNSNFLTIQDSTKSTLKT